MKEIFARLAAGQNLTEEEMAAVVEKIATGQVSQAQVAAFLPGIVQLDWALRYARQYLGLNGRFVAVENLKFLGLVLPDTTLQLSLRWQESEGRLEFAFFDKQRKYASGRVLFALDE